MLSALNTGCLYSPGPEYGRKDYINEKFPRLAGLQRGASTNCAIACSILKVTKTNLSGRLYEYYHEKLLPSEATTEFKESVTSFETEGLGSATLSKNRA